MALSNLAINRQNQLTIAEALGVAGCWEAIVDEAMHRAHTGPKRLDAMPGSAQAEASPIAQQCG